MQTFRKNNGNDENKKIKYKKRIFTIRTKSNNENVFHKNEITTLLKDFLVYTVYINDVHYIINIKEV